MLIVVDGSCLAPSTDARDTGRCAFDDAAFPSFDYTKGMSCGAPPERGARRSGYRASPPLAF